MSRTIEPMQFRNPVAFFRGPAKIGKRTRESESQEGRHMSVLLYAFGAIAVIWICVLLGSPYFGSDH